MIKNSLKFMLIFASLFSVVGAEPIDLFQNLKGIEISIKSEKSLIVGNNPFIITLTKNGKQITDAKIKLKFFMPEMPGMPYMEFKTRPKYEDENYKTSINFSMSGTWQFIMKFKTKDEKVYKVRSSINL